MRANVVEVPHKKWAVQRNLGLDKGTRDALADYCRHRWPSNTAKHAAREFDLSTDEARGVVAAKSSLTTYDKIKKAGGWPVIFAVEAMVIGQGADQYLIELRASYAEQGERLDALTHGLWPLRRASGDDPAGLDLPLADRPQPVRRRVG